MKIVVTGSNKGIGKEIVHQLSKMLTDSTIILTSRDEKLGKSKKKN
jgi:short-subunit dehydrogenase